MLCSGRKRNGVAFNAFFSYMRFNYAWIRLFGILTFIIQWACRQFSYQRISTNNRFQDSDKDNAHRVARKGLPYITTISHNIAWKSSGEFDCTGKRVGYSNYKYKRQIYKNENDTLISKILAFYSFLPLHKIGVFMIKSRNIILCHKYRFSMVFRIQFERMAFAQHIYNLRVYTVCAQYRQLLCHCVRCLFSGPLKLN